jgi:hypothetical protein
MKRELFLFSKTTTYPTALVFKDFSMDYITGERRVNYDEL